MLRLKRLTVKITKSRNGMVRQQLSHTFRTVHVHAQR